MSQTGNADHFKRDRLLAVVLHSALALVLLVFFVFLVPVAVEWTLKDTLGRLPTPIRFVLSLSNLVKDWLISSLPVVVLLPWLDAMIFSSIHRRLGESRARIWARAVVWAFIAFLAFCVWALFLAF